MTIWNQASHKSRTYRTPKPYKPVEPVGFSIHKYDYDPTALGRKGQDTLVAFGLLDSSGASLVDFKACKCGYTICSKKGACAPKEPEYRPRKPLLPDEYPAGGYAHQMNLTQMARKTYADLAEEMGRVAPTSWFFSVPLPVAMNLIEQKISKFGPGFHSPASKKELADELRAAYNGIRGRAPAGMPCTACGRAGTTLAGRVCADMRDCEQSMRPKKTGRVSLSA